jgi:hypothetical protein
MLSAGILELTQELLLVVCEELFEEIPKKLALKSAMMEIVSTEMDAAPHAL